MKIKFLEGQAANLQSENNDLTETLKINKSIIQSFMSSEDPDL